MGQQGGGCADGGQITAHSVGFLDQGQGEQVHLHGLHAPLPSGQEQHVLGGEDDLLQRQVGGNSDAMPASHGGGVQPHQGNRQSGPAEQVGGDQGLGLFKASARRI